MAKTVESAVGRVAAKGYWQEDDARVLVDALTESGESLASFNDNHAARVINTATAVIIVSDGYDTGPPALLAEQMARLKRRARRVIWLNPMIGWRDYAPVAAGMAAAVPYIDLFAPAHNLESLAALEHYLVKI